MIAQIFLSVLGLYLLMGFLFALWFVNRGASRLDENAASANWKLKALWLPGAMALWPILFNKLRKKKSS
ncbi:MAG: hypothetical protein AAGG75_22485 [Bacteroidota bacterium]